MDKKTPLYDTHVKYGGKIVPFGGFLLPIQYESGIIRNSIIMHQIMELGFLTHVSGAIINLGYYY